MIKFKQVKAPGLINGNTTYSGSAGEIVQKSRKCQHEWRTLQGWKTECDNCGMSLEYALQLAEKQVAELTARAENAEAQNVHMRKALEAISAAILAGAHQEWVAGLAQKALAGEVRNND